MTARPKKNIVVLVALLLLLAPLGNRSGFAADTETIIVYVTKTGEKYHLSGCRYLRSSKIALSLDEAKELGYDPCSVCKPPR